MSSRRAVLRLTEWSQNIQAFQAFIDAATEAGAGPRSRIQYAVDEKGGHCAYIELPEKAAAALERRERPPVRTKNQQAVKDQLDDRKKAIEAGESVPGHVPPAVRKGKLRVKKK